MTKTVYTLGYTGKKITEIVAIAQELDAVIFDVRYSPHSRNPQKNKENFQRALGRRYEHHRELGNSAYRTGGIKIVDLEAGIKNIQVSDKPVILMCSCKNYECCHRKTIADELLERGFAVQEVDTSQPALF